MSICENMLTEVSLLLLILETSLCADRVYRIDEENDPGTFVGDIAADTKLLGIISPKDDSNIWFSQLHQENTNTSKLFNVTKTGKLYTAQRLDAETLCKYNVECFKMVDVAVQQKKYFIKILEVKIIIEDINDNKPEFRNKEIELEFYETDGKGTKKSIPNAIDKDVGIQNSQITYLLKNNNDDLFTLSVSKNMDGTSKIGIILQEKLDREVQDSYQLQVIAKDGGHPPREGVLNLQISVRDENDNSPVFSQNIYNVSIKNGYQRSTPIVTLSATDLDSGKNGKVMYQFSPKTSESARAYFKLNESTGEIWVVQKFPTGSKKVYKLFVKAKDGGNPSLGSVALVLVNINNQENNPPDIDMNFIAKSPENLPSISEGVKVGNFIAYVKVTDDNEVSCYINHDHFQLQALARKKYKVVIKKTVDREVENHIDFTITCEDKGSPPLKTEKRFSVQVSDVNDVQPTFTKDTFEFLTYENENRNFPVGFINATDPDLGSGGELSYFLISRDGSVLPFKISHLGFISTTQSLDREQHDIYRFKVLVKDNGTPSLNNTANVVVEVMDKNDNTPYFTFPSVNPFNLDFHHHPQSKSDITTLRASDRDKHVNAFLRYEILGGNDKHLFKVNHYTGVLSFSRTVYQNDAGSYNLKLAVKDNGTPVLSATTTLSLTLTVSNTTAKMYISEDTESDNRIHINLMIIIVVAAVIVSVAIVVSVIVCVVHKRNQKENHYGATQDFVGERRPSGYVCEQDSPKYDVPVAILSDPKQIRNSKTALFRRDPHSIYKPGQSWKGSSLGVQLQCITPELHQIQGNPPDFSVTRVIGKDQQHMVMSPDRFSEMSTMSSVTDSGHGCSEASTAHYETLPGLKSLQEQTPSTGRKSLSQTLIKPKARI
ncbi:protocadherin beta-15 [Octopus sinensis]|uniref:Protocadherin beta-15 n=1 Tax=Octopus sinensis TaxID=2607531 RepID=A0A7E6FBJ8_9MOLL|nr:protocadherin beta-15 [Octopus sinensis]